MERKGYRTFTDVCEDQKVICDGSQSVYRHMKSQEVQIATLRRENYVKIPRKVMRTYKLSVTRISVAVLVRAVI